MRGIFISLILRKIGEKYHIHNFVVCDNCKTEVDILNMSGYEDICEKAGWVKRIEYDVNANAGEKYKLFHFCPKCSLEQKNKLQGVS
jgi:hypothetical protein